jgi:hypothetical protein
LSRKEKEKPQSFRTVASPVTDFRERRLLCPYRSLCFRWTTAPLRSRLRFRRFSAVFPGRRCFHNNRFLHRRCSQNSLCQTYLRSAFLADDLLTWKSNNSSAAPCIGALDNFASSLPCHRVSFHLPRNNKTGIFCIKSMEELNEHFFIVNSIFEVKHLHSFFSVTFGVNRLL